MRNSRNSSSKEANASKRMRNPWNSPSNEANACRFLKQLRNRSDQTMDYFMGILFVTGLLLSQPCGTWHLGIGVGGMLVMAYYSAKVVLPDSNFYQYVLSVVIGTFMVQYDFQLNGMFELGLFAFLGSAVLATYQNWKLQIPLALMLFLRYMLFDNLKFLGMGRAAFTHMEQMPLQPMVMKGLLATAIFGFCALWAYRSKTATLHHIYRSFENAEGIVNSYENQTNVNSGQLQAAESLARPNKLLRTSVDATPSIHCHLPDSGGIVGKSGTR